MCGENEIAKECDFTRLMKVIYWYHANIQIINKKMFSVNFWGKKDIYTHVLNVRLNKISQTTKL